MQEIEKIYSEEVEQSILGCMLVYEECLRYVKKIETDEFHLEIHKKIFNLIKELEEKENPVDVISVKELAKSKGLDDKAIFSYLIKITSNIITSIKIEYYISKLKNYSIRRKIIKKSQQIIDDMYKLNSDIEAEEVKKDAMQIIADIKTETFQKKEMGMLEVLISTMEDIDNKYNKRDDLKYHTGLFELDKVIDGLHEQELTLIAARPRSWKNSISIKYC